METGPDSALMSPEHVVAELIADVLTEQSDVIEAKDDTIDDDMAAHEGSIDAPELAYELSVVI